MRKFQHSCFIYPVINLTKGEKLIVLTTMVSLNIFNNNQPMYNEVSEILLLGESKGALGVDEI